MDISHEDPGPQKDRKHGQLNVLPDGSRWLVIFLLLLALAGAGISLLLGFLGPALGACILALWAAPTLAVVAALLRNMGRWWSKRHQNEAGSPPPEGHNLESIPETTSSGTSLKKDCKRRSRKWVFSIETFSEEDEG